jgi:hypothetical protein
LARADAGMLAALGDALSYLDQDLEVLTSLAGDLLSVLERTSQNMPYPIQRTLLLALEECQDRAVHKRAVDLAVATWPAGGSQLGVTSFQRAVLGNAPDGLGLRILPTLVAIGRLHRDDASFLAHLGAPAIEALRRDFPDKAAALIAQIPTVSERRARDEGGDPPED